MTQRIVRVRIRGIYATALTQLALDHGFQVVQASRVIADRFNIPQLDLPADVTIKNIEDNLSELLVVGYSWAASTVIEVLKKELPYSFYWIGEPPLHATVKATITGKSKEGCIARIGAVEAIVTGINDDECRPGESIVAGVVKPAVKPGEKARLAPGARVIGDYVILSRQPGRPRVTISEHIHDGERKAELLSLAASYTSEGYTVHWRSSSRFAEVETLIRELEKLKKKLEEVERKTAEGSEGIYSEGETVALIHLSRPDKEKLDHLRARTVPTAPWHHSVKSMDPSLGVVIDFAEKLIGRGVDPHLVLDGLVDFLAERISQARAVELAHVKPSGAIIYIGPARVKNVEVVGSGGVVIILERRVRTRGVYDGLGVEKEPGDIIVSEIDTRKWIITHKYYSGDGAYKGTYVNINTPPEIGSDNIAYLDLEVDIVKLPNGERRVIDVEKLEEALQKGIITRALYDKVIEIVRREAGASRKTPNLHKPSSSGVT